MGTTSNFSRTRNLFFALIALLYLWPHLHTKDVDQLLFKVANIISRCHRLMERLRRLSTLDQIFESETRGGEFHDNNHSTFFLCNPLERTDRTRCPCNKDTEHGKHHNSEHGCLAERYDPKKGFHSESFECVVFLSPSHFDRYAQLVCQSVPAHIFPVRSFARIYLCSYANHSHTHISFALCQVRGSPRTLCPNPCPSDRQPCFQISATSVFTMLYELASTSLAGFIIIGNLFTILAFCLRPVLRKNPSYWYITSLAVADFLVGLLGVPATLYADENRSLRDCDITLSLHLFVVCPTFTHLLTISLDRYYKLISPFEYMKIMTLRKAHLVIAFIWISSLITVLLFMIPKHEYGETCFVITYSGTQVTPYHIMLFLILFQYIPFAFVLFCSLRVYVIASKFKQAVQQQLQVQSVSKHSVQLRYHFGKLVAADDSVSSGSGGRGGSPPVIVCQGTDTELVKSKRLYEWLSTAVKQRKVAILIASIVITAGVCWFGASTIYVMTWYCPNCGVHGTWLQFFHPWFLYLNSVINPILLIIMSDDFRKGFRHVTNICCRRGDKKLIFPHV